MEWNLLETKNETPETKTLRFLPKSKVLFKAGQYFIFYDMVSYLEDCRAYSASSVPGTDFVEITVKLVKNPHFSKHLHEMKKGDSIEVKGPHGSFFLDKTEHASELVLIGAGSGMAPLRSIMQYAQIHMPQTKTTIICSAKNESSVIYKKELIVLIKKLPENVLSPQQAGVLRSFSLVSLDR